MDDNGDNGGNALDHVYSVYLVTSQVSVQGWIHFCHRPLIAGRSRLDLGELLVHLLVVSCINFTTNRCTNRLPRSSLGPACYQRMVTKSASSPAHLLGLLQVYTMDAHTCSTNDAQAQEDCPVRLHCCRSENVTVACGEQEHTEALQH